MGFSGGGLICVIGQGLLDWYQTMGLSRELAGTAVSVTLIFLTALLTGIGVFDSFAKHAGAGTLVPITGFANAVVAPAMEFKQEDWSPGPPPNSLPWLARCWSMGFPPVCSMA